MFKFRLMAALLLGSALALSVAPVDAARKKEKETTSVSKTGRTDKKPISSKNFVKSYGKIAEQYEADQYDAALAGLQKLDSPKLSAYEKAKVAQLRGFIYYNQDQVPEALEQFSAAIATDALPNEEHFQLKLTKAELYHINDQLTESAAAFDDWLRDAEKVTGRNWALQAKNYFDQDDYTQALLYIDKAFATGDKPERAWQQMKANSLLSLERTDEAIAFGRQVLAEAPDDAEFVNFLTALLLDADKPGDAMQLLEGLRAEGKLSKENLYVNLYAAYRDLERPKDAAAVMKEGLDKGIVKPSRDRYLQVGEAFYDSEDLVSALESFQQSAQLSDSDGTADLYVGQVYLDQEKPKEARVAFTAAIQKGNLRQLGNAYYQLGIAELDSDNEAAAIAAFKKAQGYPESAKNATQALKSLGR
jgi:tetratricopeptide (TPR) repeat protein